MDNAGVQLVDEHRAGTVSASPGGQRAADRRQDKRSICQGGVRLTIDGEGIVIDGELLDVSAQGFRAFYGSEPLQQDTIVRFEHTFFRGRARVVWSSMVNGRVQSGFHILV